MTNWRYYFLNIISEPFLKNVYFDHWWQNKPFRLPTRNKTNHSPVFQNYSHTVVQYTSFNVKPTKMLSDPVAEAFGLIHRHLRVKISAMCSFRHQNNQDFVRSDGNKSRSFLPIAIMITNQTKPPLLYLDRFDYWLENETFWGLFTGKPKQWNIQQPRSTWIGWKLSNRHWNPLATTSVVPLLMLMRTILMPNHDYFDGERNALPGTGARFLGNLVPRAVYLHQLKTTGWKIVRRPGFEVGFLGRILKLFWARTFFHCLFRPLFAVLHLSFAIKWSCSIMAATPISEYQLDAGEVAFLFCNGGKESWRYVLKIQADWNLVECLAWKGRYWLLV